MTGLRGARGRRDESGGGLNGSKRKMEYDGGNTVKGVRWGGRVARGDGAGSERIKRKVCEARDVSAAEAACLPQPLLALRPARSSGVSSAGLKTGILLPFVRRTPFPSFIYLCLSAADNARPTLSLSRRLFFPLRPFHYSSAGQFTLVARRTCALRCSWF